MATSPDSPPRVVSWERSSSGRLRVVLKHLVAGFFAAAVVAVAALVAVLAVEVVTGDDSVEFLVVLVTLLFVGGPFSLLYLLAANAEGGLRDLFPSPGLRARYVLLAMPFSAAIFVGAASLPYGVAVLVFGAIVAQLVVAARQSAGELSVEDGSVRILSGVKPRSHDVRKLRDYRSLSVGRTRVVHLRYAGSLSLSPPFLLFVPERDYPAVEAALSEIAARDYGLDPSETSRAARAALAAFGALFLALAGVVGFATGGEEAILMTGPAAIVASFGVLFFVAAWAA
ncbi:hypothetical protein SAMN04488063_3612 [Halopelagius inordinatus]|uniref:PH domain-containing protein n=1 Tax=Halopelagius inordinatus TaxID=553467 RepID=A0A1I2WPR0_9EURY|nr:hypothetical protein [Halopelagius inordinatus]SFH02629.1 hypothetical protein SAMN04488063_3612 [Halopelagius inordinatus]